MGPATSNKIMDPVCGMMVEIEKSLSSSHAGKEYFFCDPDCKTNFDRQPEKYMEKKGKFGRWLERVARANEEEFGSKPPKCH